MKHLTLTALIASTLALSACGKKHADQPAPAPAPAPVAAAPSPAPAPAPAPADLSDADRERAHKQAQLDYATMEDKYINDPRAQWAAGATASSTFGDDNGKKPASSNMPDRVVGPVNDDTWTNNHQDIGFDWLETTFAKPVSATEVRVVFNKGVEAVSKLELQDTDGKWNTVWSGLAEAKADERGRRTWFVKTFEKTPYKVKAVKVTLANNVYNNYKEVNAVQLVGD